MNITLSFDTRRAELEELDEAYREYVAAFNRLWAAMNKTNITNLEVCALNANPECGRGDI